MVRSFPFLSEHPLMHRTAYLYIQLKIVRLTHQPIMKAILIWEERFAVDTCLRFDIESPQQSCDSNE
jgi:hypothetical protein